MNKLKLFVADVDGTLVNDDRKLTPITRELLEEFHSNGVLIGLASGRPYIQLPDLRYDWNLSFDFDLLIGNNGAELYDKKNNEVSTNSFLEKYEIKEIFEKMQQYNDLCNGFIYIGSTMYSQGISQLMIDSSIRHKADLVKVDNQEFFYNQELPKVLFRFENAEDLEEVISRSNYLNGDNYYCFKTQATMLEFANRKVDKQNALIEYCNKYNISIDNVITAGDMSNDNGMIKIAGLGICLINGAFDTKQCADIITQKDNNNDGLAYSIKEKVLNKLFVL